MPAFFPCLLPDELLYSAFARYQSRVRYPAQADVMRDLFGSRDTAPVLDLPGHLQVFISRLPAGGGYAITDLIKAHTLLPYFVPFQPPARKHDLEDAMSWGKAVHLRLGLRGVRWPSELKVCPECMREDRRRFGEAYWHRIHHVPGVEVCPMHRVRLMQTGLKARSSLNRQQFHPAEWFDVPRSNPVISREGFDAFLFEIAENATWLLEHGLECETGPAELRDRYMKWLASEGLMITGQRRPAKRRILQALNDRVAPGVLAWLNAQRESPRTEWLWLRDLIGESARVQHPLLHMVLWHVLGVHPSDILLGGTPSAPFGEGPWPCLNAASLHFRANTIATVVVQVGRKNKKTEGVFRCPSCGFTYVRHSAAEELPEPRIRVIDYGAEFAEEVRARVLVRGQPESAVARDLGVNRATVHRMSYAEGIVVDKLQARRTTFLLLKRNNPGASRMQLRAVAPWLYDWLRRYDRDWLLIHLPCPRVPPHRPMSSARATKAPQ